MEVAEPVYVDNPLNSTKASDQAFQQLTISSCKKMAYVISDDCIACGTCIDECPVGAISEGDKYSIDPEMCTDCGTCADACPTEAIHPAEKTATSIGFLYRTYKDKGLFPFGTAPYYFLILYRLRQYKYRKRYNRH